MPNRVAVLFACACLLGVPHFADAAWQVGAATETVRYRCESPVPPQRDVHLAAARNETESFQVLFRSDEPVADIRLEAGDLKGPDGAVLPASDARLFFQHALNLTISTHRNESFEPGWYHDALIPFRHPVTREPLPKNARFVAVPFDMAANETHGFFVDVPVPANARPGVYHGTYRLTAAGERAVAIPISLTVWNFALPRVSTLQTAFGSPAQRLRSYYRDRARAGAETEPEDWAAVDHQCAEMLTRHRINATPPAETLRPVRLEDGTYRIPDEQVVALRRFVDTWHVNAVSVPRPTSIVGDPVTESQKLKAWLRAFDGCAEALDRPGVLFFVYLKDEPNDPEAYRFVMRWGRAIRDAGSVVKVLVVEQTWTQDETWGHLHGAVDIWCPLFSLFRPESAAARQAKGETIWTYTALCQRDPTPWWHIDWPLMNYRVPAWIAWRYRIRGLLYWGGLSFWKHVEDPWTNPETYDRRNDEGKGPLWNGEGSLVYPGRACGYDGIAPSLRLKALRDAVEDYEYLAILERAGRAKEAEAIVVPLAGSWYEWDKDPAAYEKARRRLAEMILGGT